MLFHHFDRWLCAFILELTASAWIYVESKRTHTRPRITHMRLRRTHTHTTGQLENFPFKFYSFGHKSIIKDFSGTGAFNNLIVIIQVVYILCWLWGALLAALTQSGSALVQPENYPNGVRIRRGEERQESVSICCHIAIAASSLLLLARRTRAGHQSLPTEQIVFCLRAITHSMREHMGAEWTSKWTGNGWICIWFGAICWRELEDVNNTIVTFDCNVLWASVVSLSLLDSVFHGNVTCCGWMEPEGGYSLTMSHCGPWFGISWWMLQ